MQHGVASVQKCSLAAIGRASIAASRFEPGSWVQLEQFQFFFQLYCSLLFSFFGPIFGIIVADYYLIKKKKIINKDLFSASETGSYYFSGGWHIKAIYSLLIAFIFSAATIWNPDFRFLQSYSWLIGAFVGFVMHYLLSEK